ncbi:hypothetical protein HK101_002291, partial [Irineochytrium annulatum]
AVDLVRTYFTEGAERELNVPARIVTKIVKDVKEKGDCRPEVFADAAESVWTTMRLSSFPHFAKTVQATPAAVAAGGGKMRVGRKAGKSEAPVVLVK